MNLGAEIIGKFVLLIVAIAIVWTAVGFTAFAVFAWLEPMMQTTTAAALTAVILFATVAIGAVFYWLIFERASKPVAVTQQPAPASATTTSVVAVLAELAKDHPLIAIGCATLLGMSDTLRSDSNVRR